MFEVDKVINKHANDIDEKIKEANVQDVVKMLHNRIFDPLDRK